MKNGLRLMSNDDQLTVSAIIESLTGPVDSNYLPCSDEMRKKAVFVGEAVPDSSRDIGGVGEMAAHRIIRLKPIENTPVGGCKDSLYGDKAPKDGTHCADFFNCFSCASYSITGSKKELHRLFSFYWFLGVERQRARSRVWAERFMMLMDLIDNFTLENFNPDLVASAKDAARIEPLKFWKSYQIQTGSNEFNNFTRNVSIAECVGINT